MKKALITGISGQDGSYLAEYLLEKGYEVHGVKRRSSSFNTHRVDHLFQDPHESEENRFFLHYGDLTDDLSILRLIADIEPDEIYNLAAQSHVAVSFQQPLYTGDVVALGATRILEAIRILGLAKRVKYYQASTSELFGLVQETPQSESTPFHPRSPYAVAKLYAYWITVNYREAYDMFACNGILFNHESPRRGETFVTRKITRGLTRVLLGIDSCLYLGNLDALRDWGHTTDYVRMQHLMLQADSPQDYVIATGSQISIRNFIEKCLNLLGVEAYFEGSNYQEVCRVSKINNAVFSNSCKPGQVIIRIDERYFRPAEVETLLGNPEKARVELGWVPEFSIDDLCKEMIDHDLKEALKIIHMNTFNG